MLTLSVFHHSFKHRHERFNRLVTVNDSTLDISGSQMETELDSLAENHHFVLYVCFDILLCLRAIRVLLKQGLEGLSYALSVEPQAEVRNHTVGISVEPLGHALHAFKNSNVQILRIFPERLVLVVYLHVSFGSRNKFRKTAKASDDLLTDSFHSFCGLY
jgi:hypothetical protein